ncbi:LuxR family transcriptional regulator [Burkholderia thailandensis]|nr:LuxR family transcriptional regulator [Burkholderia thailandensis]
MEETGLVDIFCKLGKVISSIGAERFATDLHSLFVASMNVEATKITAWSINDMKREVVDVHLLGAFTSQHQDLWADILNVDLEKKSVEHPLSKKVLAARDTQLIHMNVLRPNQDEFGLTSSPYHDRGFQCHLVSCKTNRRYVISLCRSPQARDFTIQEMSLLKSYAETLMPLVEMHSSHRRCAMSDRPAKIPGHTVCSTGVESVRQGFEHRLKDAAIMLSDREIEVCVGLLTGNTFREMATELGVKSSTIETYIKRAAAKLGFKGRHGLIKWVLDEA